MHSSISPFARAAQIALDPDVCRRDELILRLAQLAAEHASGADVVCSSKPRAGETVTARQVRDLERALRVMKDLLVKNTSEYLARPGKALNDVGCT